MIAVLLLALLPAAAFVALAVRHTRIRGAKSGGQNFLDHLTDPAREVIVLASREVHDTGDCVLRTSHLLYGLAAQESIFGPLGAAGLTPDAVRRVAAELGPPPGPARPTLVFAADIKDLFARAVAAAGLIDGLSPAEVNRIKRAFIGPEHLLVALVNQPDCLGAQILIRLGVDLPGLRADVVAAARESMA